MSKIGWDVAGTGEYAKEGAFDERNARLAGARKRSLWSNTKANRALYGVESEHARFTLYAEIPGYPGRGSEPNVDRVAKVLAAAAWLPMHVAE
ncbi:hypothetical protein LCGC14_2912060 [marine sediment metagenome]|uniref:Uncharacterized protein n=1 Tax=marine sediment metagenome TaxID=412755 RepID=A0A0F8XRC9_9ZZZZ